MTLNPSAPPTLNAPAKVEVAVVDEALMEFATKLPFTVDEADETNPLLNKVVSVVVGCR